MVELGTYNAKLYKQIDKAFTKIGGKVHFEVKPLKEGH